MKHSTLWKRVLHEGLRGNDERESVAKQIITMPIVVDSRPADGRMTDLGKRGLAIPFNRFWYEYVVDRANAAVGMLVISDSQVDVDPASTRLAPELFASDVQHIRCITVYADSTHPPTMLSDITFGLDLNGDVVGSDDGRKMVYGSTWLNRMAAKDGLLTPIASLLDTLELMSCKNVELAPRRMDDAAATREATRRNGGHPAGYRYHVLVVRPAGAKSDAPAQEIGTMPRHVCRGHFAEYGPQFNKGLLFGRLSGRFYIPPHLKGDAKNGIVDKDYEVRA